MHSRAASDKQKPKREEDQESLDATTRSAKLRKERECNDRDRLARAQSRAAVV